MEFHLDKSGRDNSKKNPLGKESLYYAIYGNYDLNLEEIDKIREGLQWVITKNQPRRGEQLEESDQIINELCQKLRKDFARSSITLRKHHSDLPR